MAARRIDEEDQERSSEEGRTEGRRERTRERTWSEMGNGDLRLSHPFSETSRSSDVVGGGNVKLCSKEERSEDWRRQRKGARSVQATRRR